MNDVGDGPPDGELLILAHLYGLKGEVGGLKDNPPIQFPKPFHRELSVDHRHYDLTVFGSDRLVNNQGISRTNAGIMHGLALHPYQKGRGGVTDQLLVEVNATLHVVVCWGGKACFH